MRHQFGLQAICTVVFTCLLTAPLMSCGKRKLIRPTAEGARVVVGDEAPPKGLEYIDDVEGVDGSGTGEYGTKGTRTTALNDLKNRAARLGATYVLIIQEKEPGSGVFGEYPKYRIKGEAYGPGGGGEAVKEKASTGSAGGACYGNDTCNRGLSCKKGRCAKESSAGKEGGPCYGNDTCNKGLACTKGRCVDAG